MINLAEIQRCLTFAPFALITQVNTDGVMAWMHRKHAQRVTDAVLAQTYAGGSQRFALKCPMISGLRCDGHRWQEDPPDHKPEEVWEAYEDTQASAEAALIRWVEERRSFMILGAPGVGEKRSGWDVRQAMGACRVGGHPVCSDP